MNQATPGNVVWVTSISGPWVRQYAFLSAIEDTNARYGEILRRLAE